MNTDSKALAEQCPEFPHFGACYPDATCIDGYLWDLDKCDTIDGKTQLYGGGDDPCPFCNTEAYLEWAGVDTDDEEAPTKEQVLNYIKQLKERYGRPRNRMDLWTPAELSIYNAMREVEKMDADVLLTDAVVLLRQAQEKIADYIDKHPEKLAATNNNPSQKVEEWISVETLPEVGKQVLIYEPPCSTEDNGLMAVSFYAGKKPRGARFWEEWPDGQDEQPGSYMPTHWRPLPAAPLLNTKPKEKEV